MRSQAIFPPPALVLHQEQKGLKEKKTGFLSSSFKQPSPWRFKASKLFYGTQFCNEKWRLVNFAKEIKFWLKSSHFYAFCIGRCPTKTRSKVIKKTKELKARSLVIFSRFYFTFKNYFYLIMRKILECTIVMRMHIFISSTKPESWNYNIFDNFNACSTGAAFFFCCPYHYHSKHVHLVDRVLYMLFFIFYSYDPLELNVFCFCFFVCLSTFFWKYFLLNSLELFWNFRSFSYYNVFVLVVYLFICS